MTPSTANTPLFALVDGNNFYASCERVFRPHLRQQPVVVLSNNDGCIIARSNEAKALGIPMGAPLFEWKSLIQRANVHVFSANFELYGDMSRRMMSIIGEYSSAIEVYSIDEAFLAVDTSNRDWATALAALSDQVKRWLGLPISIGVAASKTLAKVANQIAKRYPERTSGLYVIDNETARLKALHWLPIGDVWGIGRSHSKRLQALGIKKAYDFTQLDPDWVKRVMGIAGLRSWLELRGESCAGLAPSGPRKTIAVTRSFSPMIEDAYSLSERIAGFTSSAAEKLRADHSLCRRLSVFIDTNRHRPDLPQHRQGIDLVLAEPSQSTIELTQQALHALAILFKPGYAYKRAGVILSDLVSCKERQLSLFASEEPRHHALMTAVDTINQRFGRHSIHLAQAPMRTPFAMHQQNLSPCYTTRISDILTIGEHGKTPAVATAPQAPAAHGSSRL